MSQDDVQKYIEAKAKFEAAHAALDKINNQLAHVSSALTRFRGNFMFSNSSIGLPADVALNPRHESANARDWPTPDQINQALADWHAGKSGVNGAWSALSDDERGALQPPPKSADPMSH